ncbi:MAG TPA: biotin synthase BioB [Nitrososphaeraceae archaeon]|nr:biotin synthase BioB [Nitrososphaeraceae archaeon]
MTSGYLMGNDNSNYNTDSFIDILINKVVNNQQICFQEAYTLLSTDNIQALAKGANTITRKFNGAVVDIESLVNAKSGRCPEDCSFCAQSSFYNTGISKYPLLPTEKLIDHARNAKNEGATSFCLVCAYRSPPEKDFEQICEAIVKIKNSIDIDVNVSLGFMTPERAKQLKSLGVKRYNHNLETAKSYFSQICTTHDYEDRINTGKIVKNAGLELCCGGIIGMGESPEQRLELAFALADLDPDEVPINILISREGTPLMYKHPLTTDDIIKTIAVWRFIMPKTILKIAGGREKYFRDNGRYALKAGANGIISGGYLTTGGNQQNKDLEMIKEIGLEV